MSFCEHHWSKLELSRTRKFLDKSFDFHRNFDHFSAFLVNIFRVTSKVRFRGYEIPKFHERPKYRQITKVSPLGRCMYVQDDPGINQPSRHLHPIRSKFSQIHIDPYQIHSWLKQVPQVSRNMLQVIMIFLKFFFHAI